MKDEKSVEERLAYLEGRIDILVKLNIRIVLSMTALIVTVITVHNI